MKCNSCGHDNAFEARFCERCGSRLEVPVETPSPATPENTSGQGALSVVPREVTGWNWGAFLLNWIWSIGNNVWIGLLSLVPYAGVIMYFVLGVKGNEWAWRYKRWNSIEHFKRTQKIWAYWGLGVLVFFIIIPLTLAIIIPNVFGR